MSVKRKENTSSERLNLMKNILMRDLELNKEDLDEAWARYEQEKVQT